MSIRASFDPGGVAAASKNIAASASARRCGSERGRSAHVAASPCSVRAASQSAASSASQNFLKISSNTTPFADRNVASSRHVPFSSRRNAAFSATESASTVPSVSAWRSHCVTAASNHR